MTKLSHSSIFSAMSLRIRTATFATLLMSLVTLIPSAFAADVVTSGTFTGASNHTTTGGVQIVKEGDTLSVILQSDFSLDGAPDPKVGFGRDGKYDSRSQLDALQANRGEQRYAIPADLNIDEYNEIYIWCEAYSVPLGVASLR